MAEILNNKTIHSLLEVTTSIQKTINDRYQNTYWIKAELNKLNFYRPSGHCFPELVEKRDGKVIAQIRSHIWKLDYERINNTFQRILHEPLKDGIKVLLQAKITFDPLYGISLHILDIDPAYTLGDLEREKQEALARLRTEGIFDKNKLLRLALLPKRIAIISVETSKGYVDFVKVLQSNSWNYRFYHYLFPALLQGDKAVRSILLQLRRIEKLKQYFDVVAIIRGGGGDVGLSCYNHYELASAIAHFPLPIFTGIGHATNETVSEMVSHTNAITPTKLAELLLQKFHEFAFPVNEAQRKIGEKVRRFLYDERSKLKTETKLFRSVTTSLLHGNKSALKNISAALQWKSGYLFKSQQELLKQYRSQLVRNITATFKNSLAKLDGIEKNVQNMSPENVLRRGYSITRVNNKSIRQLADVKTGDKISTVVLDGTVFSIVESKEKTEES